MKRAKFLWFAIVISFNAGNQSRAFVLFIVFGYCNSSRVALWTPIPGDSNSNLNLFSCILYLCFCYNSKAASLPYFLAWFCHRFFPPRCCTSSSYWVSFHPPPPTTLLSSLQSCVAFTSCIKIPQFLSWNFPVCCFGTHYWRDARNSLQNGCWSWSCNSFPVWGHCVLWPNKSHEDLQQVCTGTG